MVQPFSVVLQWHCSSSRLRESCVSRRADSSNPTQLALESTQKSPDACVIGRLRR